MITEMYPLQNSIKIIAIKLKMTTVYLLRDKKCILIDTGLLEDRDLLVNSILDIGFSFKEISLIVLTHAHGDHYGGASWFSSVFSIPVGIHHLDKEFVLSGRNATIRYADSLSKSAQLYFSDKIVERFPICEVHYDLFDGMPLNEFGVNAKIVHVPGHTKGSIAVSLPQNSAALIGDLLIASSHSQYSPSLPLITENVEETILSIKKLQSENIETFYSAHGGPFKSRYICKLLKSYVKYYHY